MYVRIAATEKLCGFESAALPLYRDGGGPLTTVLVFRSSRGGYVSDCNPTETYIRTASKQPYSISVGGGGGREAVRTLIIGMKFISKAKRCAGRGPYTNARGKWDKFVCSHRTCL